MSAIRELSESIARKTSSRASNHAESSDRPLLNEVLPEAVAMLVGATVTSLTPFTASIRFEHSWMPIYHLELEQYTTSDDTETWILMRKSLPSLPRFEVPSEPKPSRFWKSLLFDLAEFVSIRNTRALQWRKIALKFKRYVASIELPDSDSVRFNLSNDLGFIDFFYEEYHSFTPTCLIYVSGDGEVVSSLKRKDALTSSECGPWTESSLFYDHAVSFFAKCTQSVQPDC